MKIYHQTGFNSGWNIKSLIHENTGDGLIWSPVNESREKLKKISSSILANSFLDPQLYLPHDAKGKLSTYGYCPEVLSPNWMSKDYDKLRFESANICLDLQRESGFKYDVIPTRHSQDLTEEVYKRASYEFVEPYLNIITQTKKVKPVLLSVVAKRIQVIEEHSRNEMLNWITSFPEIDGVYIIFECGNNSKQIKDANFLEGALRIIQSLRQNHLEVHIGYCNTEAILYSIADPTSVTIGSYENLRRFSISRFETKEKAGGRGPNPRLYVAGLLQWIEYGYIGALDRLAPEWRNLRNGNKHELEMFTPTFKWHFTKPALYMHYFHTMNQQLKEISSITDHRDNYVISLIDISYKWFEYFNTNNVLLDSDSDGSHLTHWRNAITLFRQ